MLLQKKRYASDCNIRGVLKEETDIAVRVTTPVVN